jgi:hypothetical protein
MWRDETPEADEWDRGNSDRLDTAQEMIVIELLSVYKPDQK